MKYTAINIGPIIGTISMARKPRELWAASYMFSYLMECIINEIKNVKGNIISPAVLKGDSVKNVGLYPDRVFVKGELDIEMVKSKALEIFSSATGIDSSYVNIMYVSIEHDTKDEELPIKKLNRLLDCTELCNRTVEDESRKKVLELIQKRHESSLFKIANNNSKFKVKCLAEIATYKLSKVNPNQWNELSKKLHVDDEEENEEENFYTEIKKEFKQEYKSYYKYICVVQADGDNMGKIVSSLDPEKVQLLSAALLDYGSAASRMIEGYGGLPVYAGGDDLLFIAPVVSRCMVKDKDGKEVLIRNIFELISAIDELYISTVDKRLDKVDLGRPKDKDNDDKPINTTLSYGLSISYYKYPLYEALESARFLLFDKAKEAKDKNAIAWCLRKNSGSGLMGIFTKDTTEGSIYSIFNELMKFSVDESLISAIAHKLRSNEDLLDILRGCSSSTNDNRIRALYKKIMEESVLDDKSYIGTTRRLLLALFDKYAGETDVKMGEILETMYGMLRTAKFINGEGDSDE